MLPFLSLLSTCLCPHSSPGGSAPSEGPALSPKWRMLLLADAKPSNCKPVLLSLSGCAADARWPPHTQTYSFVLSPEETCRFAVSRLTHRRINTLFVHADTHTKGRLWCCILPPEGADNVPLSPLALAQNSFRDQRISRPDVQQNKRTRRQ